LRRRKTFHSKVRLPRDKAAGAKALAAPVLSYAPMLVHGPLASGVAAEALCDCLKRLRAWGKM